MFGNFKKKVLLEFRKLYFVAGRDGMLYRIRL